MKTPRDRRAYKAAWARKKTANADADTKARLATIQKKSVMKRKSSETPEERRSRLDSILTSRKKLKQGWTADDFAREREYFRLKAAERRKNKREDYYAHKRRYEKEKSENDHIYATVKRLRRRFWGATKNLTSKKKSSVIRDLVGCSVRELISHLESQFIDGMSWENRTLWHIDHKIPISKFNLLDERQLKSCFHYTNLQPLWALDNIRKGNKMDYPCPSLHPKKRSPGFCPAGASAFSVD